MLDGTLLLILMTGAVSLAALARRRDIQPSLVVVTVAGAASFIPGIPRLELEPEVILGIVVPLLLFAATRNFAVTQFFRHLKVILGLGVLLVLVTGLVAGLAAAWIIPGIGFASAMVLGAVVSPPDTVTIVTHGRHIGMSRRVMSMLMGECLVNDAAALTLFAVTIAAVAGTDTFIENPLLLFGFDVVLGIIIGIVLGWLTNVARRLLGDPSLATVLGVILPFSAYLVAEHLHASGILAVVAAGFTMTIGSNRVDYRVRLRDDHVWASLDSLLETFVFAYMGMQLASVVDAVEQQDAVGVTIGGIIILLVVIAVRPAFVFLLFGQIRLRHNLKNRRRERTGRDPIGTPKLSAKEGVILSWTGMRGIVTLAAAGGIPHLTAAGDPFPGRPAIQAIAFIVAIGTLLIQGSSLPWLIRRLDVDHTEEQRQESESLAAVDDVAHRAALDVIASRDTEGDSALARRAGAILAREDEDNQGIDVDSLGDRSQLFELWHEIADAQRDALIARWRSGELDEEAIRIALHRIDLREAAIRASQES